MFNKDDPHTALVNAVKSGDINRMRIALKSGADPNTAPNGEPLLCYAAGISAYPTTLLATLLDAGAEPNVTDEFGVTPLMYALSKGKADRAELLLAAGANVNYQHVPGESATPLLYALQHDIDKDGQECTACVMKYAPDLLLPMRVKLFHGEQARSCTAISYLGARAARRHMDSESGTVSLHDECARAKQLLAMVQGKDENSPLAELVTQEGYDEARARFQARAKAQAARWKL